MGSVLLAGLALSLGAPALPARTDWVGDWVFIKDSGVAYGTIEPDGSFKPVGTLKSLQYRVEKDVDDRIQVNQEGKPVWILKADMVRMKDAVDHYTKRLDAEPNEDKWFAFRGWARFRTGKPDEALKDYAEAIRLHPEASSWYGNRGIVLSELKRDDEAIADFTSSIELYPDNAGSYRNRARLHIRKKDFAKASADYAKVVEIEPESSVGHNGLAWLLCTAPEEKVRDGKRALEHAKKACELTDYKNGGYLDTLAAAHAELGEFDKAVEWQEKALKAGDLPIKDLDAAKKRLQLFKDKKPYRGDE